MLFPELEPGPVIVCPGPLSESDRTPVALQAFHLLRTYHHPEAHLVFTGRPSRPGYGHVLNRLILELGLHQVHFMPHLDDELRRALEVRADVLLSRVDASPARVAVALSNALDNLAAKAPAR